MNDYYSNLPHGSYLETIEKINKSLMPICGSRRRYEFDSPDGACGCAGAFDGGEDA